MSLNLASAYDGVSGCQWQARVRSALPPMHCRFDRTVLPTCMLRRAVQAGITRGDSLVLCKSGHAFEVIDDSNKVPSRREGHARRAAKNLLPTGAPAPAYRSRARACKRRYHGTLAKRGNEAADLATSVPALMRSPERDWPEADEVTLAGLKLFGENSVCGRAWRRRLRRCPGCGRRRTRDAGSGGLGSFIRPEVVRIKLGQAVDAAEEFEEADVRVCLAWFVCGASRAARQRERSEYRKT